jgi:murein L,D-transpeptidase YcbB/YkuD
LRGSSRIVPPTGELTSRPWSAPAEASPGYDAGKRERRVVVPVFLIALVLTASFQATLESRIRERIEQLASEGVLRVGNETIHASSVLASGYEKRGYRAVWTDSKGLLDVAEELRRALERAPEHGLDPLDYHFDRILNLKLAIERRGLNPATDLLVDLELLLSDALLMYASHLTGGAVDRFTIDPEWFAVSREADLARIFEEAAATGRVGDVLDRLPPTDPRYARLKTALAHYRELDRRGAPSRLGSGAALKPGARDDQVPLLRERLAMALERPFLASGGEDDTFDPALVEAVREIQRRYGLVQDGVVGGATREALNREPEDLVRQLEVNLERWRWLPDELGDRYAIVNIAAFELDVVEAGSAPLSMRVVVGAPYRRTPVLSSQITHVVLNPSWTVPERLVKEDILPRVRKEPGYLASTHLRVFDGWSDDAPEIDPAGVDWSSVKPGRYRFRQDPGPWNALGRVKFLLPNSYDIYLHDTPQRELFARASRVFSSGCVRLETPLALVDYLLAKERRWSQQEIERTFARGEERFVRLEHPLPVHILYWTAWVEDDATVHFRKDIYGRDELVSRALREQPGSD